MGKPVNRAVRGRMQDKVLQFVRTHRAIHKAQVARQLKIGWSTVQHHARALLRERKIREIQQGRHRFLLPAEIPSHRAARVVVMASPANKRALAAVARGHHERIQDLAKRLGWSRKEARRSLYALVSVGLLEKTNDYHPRFVPTAAAHAELRRV